jgi:heme/copper-type cytochrome/quinol oxidase subunit 2
MKWDLDKDDAGSGQNNYACLNIECQDQFKSWIEGIIQRHLLLTGILVLVMFVSIQVSYRMKNKFSDDNIYTMWHDDISLGMSVFFLFCIIILSFLFLNFSPQMIKIKDLRKFNHYTEFEREKHLDSKFMILK